MTIKVLNQVGKKNGFPVTAKVVDGNLKVSYCRTKKPNPTIFTAFYRSGHLVDNGGNELRVSASVIRNCEAVVSDAIQSGIEVDFY